MADYEAGTTCLRGGWVRGRGSGGIGLQDQWEEGTENYGRDAVARVGVCMG